MQEKRGTTFFESSYEDCLSSPRIPQRTVSGAEDMMMTAQLEDEKFYVHKASRKKRFEL